MDVAAGSEISLSYTVPASFVLDGYFTVSGGNEQITFWATGDTTIDKKNVNGREDFNLLGRQGTTYTLHFENAKAPVALKTITIYYRIVAN